MEIASNVKEIVAEQLGVDLAGISDTSSFVDDLDADSLAVVELVLAFEERFDIVIPEAQTENIKTVGDAIAYISAHAKAS